VLIALVSVKIYRERWLSANAMRDSLEAIDEGSWSVFVLMHGENLIQGIFVRIHMNHPTKNHW
jgi:hypothetical protein